MSNLESANGNPPADPAQVSNPPKNPDHIVVPENHPLKQALASKNTQIESLRTQNADLEKKFNELSARFGMVEGALGSVDPSSLTQIQSALQAQAEMDQRLQAARNEAAKEIEAKYTQSVDQLTANLNQTQQQYQQAVEDQALRQLFVECGGRDYAYFKAMLGVQYQPVFTEGNQPKVQSIVNKDGSPVTDNEGKPLSAKEVLMSLRQGKLNDSSGVFKNTFVPFNGSTGHGYVPGVNMPGSDSPNPFSAENWHLGEISKLYKTDKALGKQLAVQSKNPQALLMVKNW